MFSALSTQIQTAYQRTVPVPLQKTRTVQAYRTSYQNLRYMVPYRTAIFAAHYSILYTAALHTAHCTG